MSQLNLSARVYYRILKLAHTIAGLTGCEEIQSVLFAEASPYGLKIFFYAIKSRVPEVQKPERGHTPLEIQARDPISLSGGCRRGR